MTATHTLVDGFVIGVIPPPVGETVANYKDKKYLGHMPPPEQPFRLGDTVRKFTRAEDLGQDFVVVGLAYSFYSDSHWTATITRKGESELHRNSLYRIGTHRLQLQP